MDNSFLRLKNDFTQAKNLDESKVVELEYVGQVHLVPGETYLQITNSDVAINFSNIKVELVDECDNVLYDVSNQVFWEAFIDTNGVRQIVWEYMNLVDTSTQSVSLKFTELINEESFWTNLFISTDYRKEFTSRIDYKNNGFHYGTQYNRADYYQSIRLSMYYNNPVNESERAEYHQISTDITVPQRNVKKRKRRFILDEFDYFTVERLETLASSSEIYIDNKRYYSTTPIEYPVREGDSNMFEGEALFNPTDEIFIYSDQIFSGLEQTIIRPLGLYLSNSVIPKPKIEYSVPVSFTGNGSIRLYNQNGVLLHTFIDTDFELTNNTIDDISDFELPNSVGSYYFNISEGFVSWNGMLNEAVLNDTTWVYQIQNSDYDSSDYNNEDYLTAVPGLPNPYVDNLTLFYKFNETSGTTATDDSSENNDGTLTNVFINQTGLIDKCYSFNTGGNTDQYVTVPDSDSLSFGSGAFSIEIWVNADANFGQILNKYNATTGDLEYRMFIQSGVLQFYIYTDASNRLAIADNATITTGVWQQIIVTYDGSGDASGLKMKVNTVDASFASSQTGNYTGMPNTGQNVVLGQQADDLTGSNRFSGKMDILRIWKGYVLDDENITELYNSGNGTEN